MLGIGHIGCADAESILLRKYFSIHGFHSNILLCLPPDTGEKLNFPQPLSGASCPHSAIGSLKKS